MTVILPGRLHVRFRLGSSSTIIQNKRIRKVLSKFILYCTSLCLAKFVSPHTIHCYSTHDQVVFFFLKATISLQDRQNTTVNNLSNMSNIPYIKRCIPYNVCSPNEIYTMDFQTSNSRTDSVTSNLQIGSP